jgi:hypothetical protein
MLDWLRTIDTIADGPLPAIGIAIRRLKEREQWHCGLVYAIEGSGDSAPEIRLLHLRWHADLEVSRPGRRYSWVMLPIPAVRVPALIALLRKLGSAAASTRIVYAVRYEGSRFRTDGTLELAPGCSGLTCATFVLAVLRAYGVELDLLDHCKWQPRSEDAQWHDRIVAQLRADQKARRIDITNDEIAIVERERGCCRVRPEEVVASCTSVQLPATFDHASAVAHDVRARVKLTP